MLRLLRPGGLLPCLLRPRGLLLHPGGLLLCGSLHSVCLLFVISYVMVCVMHFVFKCVFIALL